MINTRTSFCVLHLCSDYAKQSLYSKLVSSIAAPGLDQFIYIPTRTKEELSLNRIYNNPSIQFHYEHLLRPYHRVMFRAKIRQVFSSVLVNTPIERFKMVHAHFLYSDGAVALKLFERFRLPYIVAIRNTDVNSFMRYRPDLTSLRNKILHSAGKVIFISPAYFEVVINQLPKSTRNIVASKSSIIPNGLSPEWFDNFSIPCKEPKKINEPLKLLYVGDFTQNKNIANIIAALRILRSERPTTLTIVGGGGDKLGFVKRLLDSSACEGVNVLGRINDTARLIKIYRSCDVFVMPSFHETFGLAYIEALSQGVPIICSQGEGIDGFPKLKNVSKVIDPSDPHSIAEGIKKLALQLPLIREDCRQASMQFDWRQIGPLYQDVYYSIVGQLK